MTATWEFWITVGTQADAPFLRWMSSPRSGRLEAIVWHLQPSRPIAAVLTAEERGSRVGVLWTSAGKREHHTISRRTSSGG